MTPAGKENDPAISACAPPSSSRSRRRSSAIWRNSSNASRRTPTTIRRASISPLRSIVKPPRRSGRQLVDIVKRDRTWNEDGARKQLLQFFEAWGYKDEASIVGRASFQPCSSHKPGRGAHAQKPVMPMNPVYGSSKDCPETIPVFPLPGALLCGGADAAPTSAEPRYVAMFEDVERHLPPRQQERAGKREDRTCPGSPSTSDRPGSSA